VAQLPVNPVPFGGSLVESRPGFPLSLEQVEERTWKSADGIPGKETRATNVYRDSQGRVRLETRGEGPPDSPLRVDVFDPVGGSMVHLDTSGKVAHRLRAPGIGAPMGGGFLGAQDAEPKIEIIGQRTIDGIAFLGVRVTAAPASAPATTAIIERWIMPEMGLTSLIEGSSANWSYSARIGNLERKEPDAQLFVIPEGYTIEEEIPRPAKR
jgi:hypothetical protein